jgi:glycosyltransferase involved in cell wall biosynthesis
MRITDMSIDVVIPARNEEKTIGAIVEVFKVHPCVRGVIVSVDSDTTDDTNIAASWAGAELEDPRLHSNCGKGQVVFAALHRVTADHVLFCDADYTGLTYDHVSQMCAMITEVPRGLILGVPDYPAGPDKWHPDRHIPGHVFKSWHWCTGFRGMPTDFVRDIPMHGYLMETQINQAARAHSMPVVYERLFGLKSEYNITPQRKAEMERDRAYGIEKGILKP